MRRAIAVVVAALVTACMLLPPVSSLPHTLPGGRESLSGGAPGFRVSVAVLAFDRSGPLSRLLRSLQRVRWLGHRVDLRILQDAPPEKYTRLSEWQLTARMIDDFEWRFGRKSVQRRVSNAGLVTQWLEVWWPEEGRDTEFLMVLEDDVELAVDSYAWMVGALQRYVLDETSDDHIPELCGMSAFATRYTLRAQSSSLEYVDLHPSGPDHGSAYLYQNPHSWAPLLLPRCWGEFRRWLQYDDARGAEGVARGGEGWMRRGWHRRTRTVAPLLPSNNWNDSWLQLWVRFMVERGRVFLYPRLTPDVVATLPQTGGQDQRFPSLAVHHFDIGVHYHEKRTPRETLLASGDGVAEGLVAALPQRGALHVYDIYGREVGVGIAGLSSVPRVQSIEHAGYCFVAGHLRSLPADFWELLSTFDPAWSGRWRARKIARYLRAAIPDLRVVMAADTADCARVLVADDVSPSVWRDLLARHARTDVIAVAALSAPSAVEGVFRELDLGGDNNPSGSPLRVLAVSRALRDAVMRGVAARGGSEGVVAVEYAALPPMWLTPSRHALSHGLEPEIRTGGPRVLVYHANAAGDGTAAATALCNALTSRGAAACDVIRPGIKAETFNAAHVYVSLAATASPEHTPLDLNLVEAAYQAKLCLAAPGAADLDGVIALDNPTASADDVAAVVLDRWSEWPGPGLEHGARVPGIEGWVEGVARGVVPAA